MIVFTVRAYSPSYMSTKSFRRKHLPSYRYFRTLQFPPPMTKAESSAILPAELPYRPDRRRRFFTPHEDQTLRDHRARGDTFANIGHLLSRSSASCSRRYERLTTPPVRNGRWNAAEDQALLRAWEAAKAPGDKRWISKFARSIGRAPNSTRQRLWCIRADLKHGKLTEAEWSVVRERVTAARLCGSPISWVQIGKQLNRDSGRVRGAWRKFTGMKSGAWSEHEDQMLSDRASSALNIGIRIPWTEIGRLLGRTGWGVQYRWRSLERRKHHPEGTYSRWSRDEENALLAFVAQVSGKRIRWSKFHAANRSDKSKACKYGELKKRGAVVENRGG